MTPNEPTPPHPFGVRPGERVMFRTNAYLLTIAAAAWLMPALLTRSAAAQEGEEVSISDNSFLIEEAYNQEPGVIQHIFNWVPSWDWQGHDNGAFDFVFTQEWPIGSQKHQFSYTIPLRHFKEFTPGEPLDHESGIGDIMLNYRYQVLGGEGTEFSFAPRFSLILPTGDEERGLGAGHLGYQVNLPFSKSFDRWATHFNAGATYVPNAQGGVDPGLAFEGSDRNGYNLGGSVIRFVRPNFHLMLEALMLWDEELDNQGVEDKTFEFYLCPGFRWAVFTRDDTQWVLGLGLPIGLTPDAPDISLFGYMSFEHSIRGLCRQACCR